MQRTTPPGHVKHPNHATKRAGPPRRYPGGLARTDWPCADYDRLPGPFGQQLQLVKQAVNVVEVFLGQLAQQLGDAANAVLAVLGQGRARRAAVRQTSILRLSCGLIGRR